MSNGRIDLHISGALAFFMIVTGITVIAYHYSFYSFFVGPKGDISRYFLQTQNCGIIDLIKGQYSQNIILLGDTLLYRPLTIAILGLQKWSFGANYTLWVVTGVALHIGVALSMYRFLTAAGGGIFAWLLPVLFAVNRMYALLVLWTHVNGYPIFMILVITSLFSLYDFTVRGRRDRRNLLAAGLAMCFASFFYESGVVFSALFFIYLLVMEGRAAGRPFKFRADHLILLVPVLLYLSAYCAHIFCNYDWVMQFESEKTLGIANISESVVAIPRIFFLWSLRSFFGTLTPLTGTILFVSALYLGAVSLMTARDNRENLPFAALIAFMMLGHVSINCLGRGGTHGIAYLYSGLGGPYLFGSLLMIFIYMASGLGVFEKTGRIFRRAGILALALFLIFNVYGTVKVNKKALEERRPARLYFDAMQDFVKRHIHEKDFSFAVTTPTPWLLTVTEGYYHPKDYFMKDEAAKTRASKDVNFAEIFFGEYYDKAHPKYSIAYDEERDKFIIS
ncbi:MAG: hypothetical protein WC515_08180 [Candidatus Omnitrophota bacterium]